MCEEWLMACNKGFLEFDGMNQEVILKSQCAMAGSGLNGVLIPAIPTSKKAFAHVATKTAMQFAAEIKVIEQRMAELCKATREIPGWRICLDIQRRRNAKSLALRWRNITGGHVPDSAVMTMLEGYPPVLLEWYRSVRLHVLWLNAAERICRRAESEYSALAESINEVLVQHSPLDASARSRFS